MVANNPLIAKLLHAEALTTADVECLQEVMEERRVVPARRDIISAGDRPEDVHLILSGFAARYKLLPDGSRQIMAWLLPGDFCDLHVAILGRMDHSIMTLSECLIVDIPRSIIDRLTSTHPRITRALWWATLVDEAVLREWLVSMGRRPADRQLAHLFAEIQLRLEVAGIACDDGFELPVTQEELGDTLGMTSVHTNRTLQRIRKQGLIRTEGRHVIVPDREALWDYADFDPLYLHLQRRPDSRAALHAEHHQRQPM